MARRLSPSVAFALALAVHVALMASIAVVRPRGPALDPARSFVEQDVEVSIESNAGASESQVAKTTPESPATSTKEPIRPGKSNGSATVEASEPVAEAEHGDVVATTNGVERGDAGAPTDGWLFHPSGAVDIGLGGGARYAPDARAQAEQPVVLSNSGGLAEALDVRDVGLGLGRGGPVRSAVEEAARSGAAPIFGIATFSVAIRPDGSIDVSLTDANRDHAGWEGLKAAIRTSLAKRPVRLPAKSAGIRVAVRVEASEMFPDGAPPTPDDKQGVAAKAQFFRIKETKDHIEISLPYAAIGYRTRACGGGLAVSPGGLTAGAGCHEGTAMRVVATRIVSEQRL